MKNRSVVVVFFAGVLTTVLASLLIYMSVDFTVITKSEYDGLTNMEEKYEKAEKIRIDLHKKYYLEIDDETIENGMYKGMFEAIGDKYSTYMTEDEFKDYKDSTNGNYVGIGILSDVSDDTIRITRVFPNSPAEKAGIENGDVIFQVDDSHIDDVGGGVLFGLSDYKFELLALMLHNDHLEEEFGVGFHTISVPRLQKAEGMELNMFPNLVTNEEFKKIVAIIRLAVPFTGIILSTRESQEMRKEVINYGVSQVSAGSCTGVGGYKEEAEGSKKVDQFEVADHRAPIEIIKELMRDGFVPSYCTACYRSGRTGDRFMRLAKSGQIHNVCSPNALMTLQEFAIDYGDNELRELAESLIDSSVVKIEKDTIRDLTVKNLEKIKNGERDLFV
jgi:[FeFe] hydrogenase H-cluster radical SAM maturase HydG